MSQQTAINTFDEILSMDGPDEEYTRDSTTDVQRDIKGKRPYDVLDSSNITDAESEVYTIISKVSDTLTGFSSQYKQDHDKFINQITENNTKIEDISDSLRELIELSRTYNDRIRSLSTTASKQHTNISNMQATIHNHNTNISALQERIDIMEKKNDFTFGVVIGGFVTLAVYLLWRVNKRAH
jgi:DNA repair ATPase RecN